MTHTTFYNSKRWFRNILCAGVGVLCLFSLFFFLRPLYSVGISMLPTIEDGQFLVTMPKALNPFLELQQGDVVIVRCEEKHIFLTKRLIAQPGDTLEIRSNQIYVNGTQLREPYLYESMVTQDVTPFTLGEDMYYVLGDNRNVSADSRLYGLFSGADIYAIVDLENQGLQWALVAALVVNAFVWLAYLPDWDDPVDAQLAAPVAAEA